MDVTQTQLALNELIHGLSQAQKKLPAKYFYDETGSILFDQITALNEYYPTRAETEILRTQINEIVETIGDDAILVEYGSGSSVKTEILLDHLPNLIAYLPIEISGEHLCKSVGRLSAKYPQLQIIPLEADYTRPIQLPQSGLHRRKVAFFPGSTIGNFEPNDAVQFLRQVGDLIGDDGGLLIGVDMKKDPAVLHAAYNDAAGVTAAFNLNMLTHLNRSFGTDFDADRFYHYAFYNTYHGRIEMHLVSETDQIVNLVGQRFPLRQGETIWTESSYKYSPFEFDLLARKAGLAVNQVWLDSAQRFSLHYLVKC